MPKSARNYDQPAAHYHLLFENWDAAVRRQGAVFDRLIGRMLGPDPERMPDAACGIGTQAIGLALHGHVVTGSDCSAAAVARARREARRFGVDAAFRVADLRTLSRSAVDRFAVVCALDNAVAHLECDAALATALGEMAEFAAPGGLVMISIRDYDALLAERPAGTPERVFEEAGGRLRIYQLWDWRNDASYRFRLFIVWEDSGGNETLVFEGWSRAVNRAQVIRAFEAAGLSSVQWLEPEQSGFYQPVAVAFRSAA